MGVNHQLMFCRQNKVMKSKSLFERIAGLVEAYDGTRIESRSDLLGVLNSRLEKGSSVDHENFLKDMNSAMNSIYDRRIAQTTSRYRAKRSA